MLKSEDQLLKIVKKFCQKKRLKLVILGRNKNKRKKLIEKKYFTNILGNDYHFAENYLKRNTYKIIDNSKIVVSSGSTVGLESLGRKKKTAIIHAWPNKYPTKTNFWGYYTKRKNHGFFWNNGVDEKKVLKILNRLIKISLPQWRNKIKNYEYETAVYDYKNYNLKKNLKDFLNKEKININPYLV
jgi:surface carbohydrate biosynthesis protein